MWTFFKVSAGSNQIGPEESGYSDGAGVGAALLAETEKVKRVRMEVERAQAMT